MALIRDFDKLWDYDKPADTEANFRSMLVDPEDEDYRLELLTQIARCQGLQREFDTANETLDEVDLATEDRQDRVRVRYLLERGRALNSSGEKKRAIPLFTEAWDLGKDINEDFFAVDAAHMLAIADIDHAMRWNLKALALAEKSEDERARGWLGSLYNNIGWTYHGQSQFDEALAMFEKALAERVKKGDRENILVARWCIARCLRSLGRLDEALGIQRELAESRELHRESDGYVQEELGEIFLLKGDAAEAATHFGRAYLQLNADQRLKANEGERLERIRKLSVG